MQKNRLRDFDIEISHVKEHTPHKFVFQLNDSFFALFEDALIQKGLVQVDLEFEKTPLLIRMNFILNGAIELVCDRSLDTFEQPISSENILLFKFTEEEEGEITDEIIGIKRETIKINVAQYIYEFINLEVPIKKLHPRFQEEEESDAEALLIYSTENKNEEKSDSPTEDLIDPRWLALKSLKDKSKLN